MRRASEENNARKLELELDYEEVTKQTHAMRLAPRVVLDEDSAIEEGARNPVELFARMFGFRGRDTPRGSSAGSPRAGSRPTSARSWGTPREHVRI